MRSAPAATNLSGALEIEAVLLIDDTWTTGANAQSAAAALKRRAPAKVGAVVIGRHVTREWRENDRRLSALAGQFQWDECPLCAATTRPAGWSARMRRREQARCGQKAQTIVAFSPHPHRTG